MPAGAKKDGPSLRQAQERLLAAIDHLKSVTESQNVAALKAERDTLMSGLDELKGDYEILERKYRQLKSALEADGAERNDRQDAAALRQERDRLAEELARVKVDFERQAGVLASLKAEYLALQENNEHVALRLDAAIHRLEAVSAAN